VIQNEITPYTRIIMSPIKRDLLVVIITVASGLMLLFFARCARAKPIADLRVSDAHQVTSLQGGEAARNAIHPFHVNIPEDALLDLRRVQQRSGGESKRRPGPIARIPKAHLAGCAISQRVKRETSSACAR